MSHSSLLYARNSGNSYYFRSYIPKDLVAHFEGLKEFRISLKCAIKSRSNSLCKRLNNIVSRLYEEIRHGIKTLNIEQIKEILRVEIRKQILHAHHVYEGTNRWSKSGVTESLKSIQLNELNIKDKLEIKPGRRVEFGNHVYGMDLIKKPVCFSKDCNTEILDWDTIKNRRLILRYWRNGDQFKPLGLNGSQKVSDFLINNKIDRFSKDDQVILTADDDIIWVCGMRIDESVKVTSRTKQTVELQRFN